MDFGAAKPVDVLVSLCFIESTKLWLGGIPNIFNNNHIDNVYMGEKYLLICHLLDGKEHEN